MGEQSKMYYWVVDFRQSKDGLLRPVIIGGRSFTTEIRAQEYIDNSNLSPKAEIYPVDTSDMSKATRVIKAKLITKYKSLDRGLTRASHQAGK